MRSIVAAGTLTLLVSASAAAQTIQIPDRIERLAPRARESVNITLDGPLLQLAGQFLSSSDKDQAKIKNIISRLKGIHVRSFEFDSEGQFSEADVEPLRAQLRNGWSRIIESRDNGEHVEIYVKQDNGQLGGLVIISAERKELAIVSIDGTLNLSELSSLGGQFGIPPGVIPKINGGASRPAPDPRPAPQGREKDED